MQIKERIRQILRKEYPNEKGWKAFVYWWLSANGYEYDGRRSQINFVDGSGDGGIDVVAWPLENQTRTDVLVVQSKYFGASPTTKDIRRFQDAVTAINGPLSDFQGWLNDCRDDLHPLYRKLRDLRNRNRYIFIAPCRFDGACKRSLQRDRIEVHDADILSNLERNYIEGRTPRLDELRLAGASTPRQIADGNGTRVWVFTVPARELGRAFERHGDVLFAGNIRYALKGHTAQQVRKGMLETLTTTPHEFAFSHNGITVSGEGIHKSGGHLVMRSATIVNGAQTVSYLGNPGVMKQLAYNPARVIVKFVQVDDSEMLNDIESKVAFRSNSQNKVDPSDLMIDLPALVSLQRYFRREGFHLERKKGERKLYFGEPGISKERLAQVLAAVESPQGAVDGKRKQELFKGAAVRLFADYDKSEKSRAEALAWARIDAAFRATLGQFGNAKRKKRAQLAQLASLTTFHQVIRSTGLKGGLLHAMARWGSEERQVVDFLGRAFKAVIAFLLKYSAHQKKNEPAFYKAMESVKPAVDFAVRRSRKKIRLDYQRCLMA